MRDILIIAGSLLIYTVIFLFRRETGITAAYGVLDIVIIMIVSICATLLSKSGFGTKVAIFFITVVLAVAISLAIVFYYYEIYP